MAWIFRRVAVVGLATAVLSLGLVVAPALAGAESSLVSMINAERTSRGKPALQVYWDLTDDARAQASRMRDQQRVFHHPNLGSVTTGWDALAENVGVGQTIDDIMDASMASSSHRSNILNSSFNYVGVGVKEDANEIVWVSVIFMAGPDDLLDPPTTTTTTQPPATTTTTQPPSTTTTTQPPSTTTTTQPPSTTTTTQPPSTTTTTQPPSSTTTTQPPGSTTTTLPPGSTTTTTLPPDSTTATLPPGDGGTAPGEGWVWFLGQWVNPWAFHYSEFEVLSADWLNPDLLRLIGSMSR